MASSASLFEEHRDRIRRAILRRVGNAADAEDLTQETLIRAAARSETLRDPEAAVAWLLRIAERLAIDHLRARGRRIDGESLADDLSLPAHPAAPALEKSIEKAEMSDCVQDSIRSLPESYGTVLRLHDVEGLTAPEIAARLGLSAGAVKIRLHRARQRLRAALEAGCEFSRDGDDVLVCDRPSPSRLRVAAPPRKERSSRTPRSRRSPPRPR